MQNPIREKRIGLANKSISKRTWVYSVITLLGLLISGFYFSLYSIIMIGATFVAIICIFLAILRLIAASLPKPKILRWEPPTIWPFYSVLVPIFKEAHMVEQLMNDLNKLDYPHDRLEIIMICEEVDPFTIAMVRKYMRPPFKLVVVPKGVPQTKPRALNFAMLTAKGEYITIYDAEDIPRPDQLKGALQAFHENSKYGAIQAPLDYINADQNWLTRQFSLEYAALFHVWLPFLVTVKMPFPLGGTSNHMRRIALDDVGGWDAFNVTEDADLSFRLAAQKWELGFIDVPTQEEAVSNWKSWYYQRSRWMKGFIQTWIVHMRVPFAPKGRAGLKRFLILQLTIGMTLVNALFHLPILIILAIMIGLQLGQGEPVYIPPLFLISLGVSYAAGMVIGLVGALRIGKYKLLISVIWMPFYWLALFAPTLRALAELRTHPFIWHKTEHGFLFRGEKNKAIEETEQGLTVSEDYNLH